MPRNLNSSLMKPFVVLAIPGMYLFYKYNQYKRQQQEQNRRKVTERELAHLNHKIDKLLAKLEEHEPEQATNQEEECVICITAKATMQTYPCGHRVVCRKCFVKTIQTAVAQRMLPLRCVICRAKILRLKQSGSGGGGGMGPSPSTSSSLSSASSFSSFSVHSSASTFSLKSYKSDSTCSSRSSVSSVVSAISSVSSAKSVKSAKSSSSTAAQGPSTSQAHPSSSAKGCSPSARTSPATANKNANKSGGKQGSKEAKKLHHHNHHNHHHHHGHHQEHKTDANVKDAPTPTKSSKEKMSLPGRKGRSSHKSSQSLPTAKVRSRSPHKLKLQPHRLEIIKEVE